MPTTGWFRGWPPIEPENRASPKAKMPPSAATSQYPPPVAVAAMPTTGWDRSRAEASPAAGASPSAATVPSLNAVQ